MPIAMLCVQAGKLEAISTVEVPRAARKIRATFCPKVHITEPEYVVMGAEDTSVYIYDISKPWTFGDHKAAGQGCNNA